MQRGDWYLERRWPFFLQQTRVFSGWQPCCCLLYTSSRETGGTGLGLAITKSVIFMHHGSIQVESKEDIGTTFTVKIPLMYIPSTGKEKP